MKKELKYSAIIALTYLIFSTAWILFSDAALAAFVKDTEEFRHLETIKGLVFALVSALLIFGLVLTYYRRYRSFQNKYYEMHHEDDRIFRDGPNGIAIMDLKGNFIKVNRSLTELLSYSSTEMLHMNRSQICYTDASEQDDDFLLRVLKDPDRAFHVNKRLKTKDGKALWCQVSCMLMHTMSNEAKYFVLNIQNMDSEIKMQNRVSKLNLELLEAQRLGRFGHWSYNFATHRATLSDQAATILRMDSKNPEPEEILALFDESTRLDLARRVKIVSSEGGRLHSLSKLPNNAGQLKYIEIEAELLIESETGAVLLKGTIKDVTQLMQLQIERERFNKDLVHWAFKLSHELRQPISSILGIAHLMRQNLVKEEEKETLTGYLEKAASDLDGQTRDLAGQFHRMQELLNATNISNLDAISEADDFQLKAAV